VRESGILLLGITRPKPNTFKRAKEAHNVDPAKSPLGPSLGPYLLHALPQISSTKVARVQYL